MFARPNKAPTPSAWTKHDGLKALTIEVELLWACRLDTADITAELRKQGWQVTEAGVAYALAVARDRRIPMRAA